MGHEQFGFVGLTEGQVGCEEIQFSVSLRFLQQSKLSLKAENKLHLRGVGRKDGIFLNPSCQFWYGCCRTHGQLMGVDLPSLADITPMTEEAFISGDVLWEIPSDVRLEGFLLGKTRDHNKGHHRREDETSYAHFGNLS